jgi:two-component system, OmpR family, sensor histidine kinase ArlS
MKIKTKLTLLFAMIISLLLIVLNLYLYSISQSFASNDFFNRLRERTYATANVFLEEDEVSPKVFKEFQNRLMERIPGEIIRIYNSNNQPVFIKDSVPSAFSTNVINKTRKEKTFHTKDKGTWIYGIFYNDNQGDFVILASAIDDIGDAKLDNLRNDLIISFFISLIILFFIGRFFTRKMLNPINEIIKQVSTISDTNLHLRLAEGNGKDELAELAINFNRMLARIEKSFELQQNFVANASHELRTPLTSIIGNIEVSLSRPRDADEYKVILKTILEEAERLHKLSNGLLNIAQASVDVNSIKMEYIRIDELIEESKSIVQNQMPESIMELSFENMPENSDDLLIRGNKNLLMIAFENLFENANKFSDNKNVKINLLYTPGTIFVKISDSGIGIPEKDLQNVMQTFYRSENARSYSGSGVGLSLSQKIFLIHNGDLSIQTELGKGTVVSVLLKLT